jgi:hypothetical protein
VGIKILAQSVKLNKSVQTLLFFLVVGGLLSGSLYGYFKSGIMCIGPFNRELKFFRTVKRYLTSSPERIIPGVRRGYLCQEDPKKS